MVLLEPPGVWAGESWSCVGGWSPGRDPEPQAELQGGTEGRWKKCPSLPLLFCLQPGAPIGQPHLEGI